MTTLLIAVAAFIGYIVAYHTYGRWIARRIFGIDADAPVPSQQLRDDIDYVPTKKEVIFGHHFTSIAGTGPIVGPAIAVFWGWLPALLWVLFGSIFIGAVHDFSALMVSLRNRGQTVGEIAGRMITPRAKVLFLLILFFALTIVLAIFGLVIANIFKLYPESVLSVWIEIPIAIAIGYWVYKYGGGLLVPSIVALGLMYVAIYIGAYHFPISLPASWGDPVVIWTVILLVYCFVASVLPVWTLLQPRDFINSHQLVLALGLLMIGFAVACFGGQADLIGSAPAVAEKMPIGAPPIWPFLFITIACGAISGFHCLVSSGTSSKQIASEADAQYVGYGAMLLEGALAVVVILACCAGVGMGKFDRVAVPNSTAYSYEPEKINGTLVTGQDAWRTRYNAQGSWGDFRLGSKVGAFVEGGANFIATIGIPLKLAIGLMAVLVASFAATTLDTATRLQRYVVQELAATAKIKPLTNKYAATFCAVGLGFVTAMIPTGKSGLPIGQILNELFTTGNIPQDVKFGAGGMILWPLFGAVNQLLAGLAFMVTVFYLWRRNKPIMFAAIPMLIMLFLPLYALLWQMFNETTGWYGPTEDGSMRNSLLFYFATFIVALQLWIVTEGLLICKRAKGVLEEALPPLAKQSQIDGRSC